MKVLHYVPKERGIRFFRATRRILREKYKENISISDEKNFYNNFFNSKDFLDFLSCRAEYSDIVLIMAHGYKDSILKVVKNKYERDITMDQTKLFKNKFVFAISCFTAEKFGPAAIDNDALVYIGFDDSIESFFEIDDKKYKKLSEKLEVIIKKIYTRSFIQEFNRFIKECYTANEFFKYLSLRIDKEISKLAKMSYKDLNEMFSVNIKDSYSERVKKMIKLEIINRADEINEKMKILGEKNYIPWFFIHSQPIEKIPEILQKIQKIDSKYDNYRYFVEALSYKRIGKEEKYKESLKKAFKLYRENGQTFYYNYLYSSEEIATSLK